jgi:glutamine synthetase
MSKSLEQLQKELKAANIDVLRVVYLDIIGLVRAKDILVSQLDQISHGGPAFCQGIWVTTTGGDVLDAQNIISDGLQDFISQIVPESWRALPWEPGVAYVVAGANNPDGSKNLLSPRNILELMVQKYQDLGLNPIVGPELEFYIAEKDENGKYKRAIERTGQAYTTGSVTSESLQVITNSVQANMKLISGTAQLLTQRIEPF